MIPTPAVMPDAVDWVLVEARRANGNTVASTSGLLDNHGRVGTDAEGLGILEAAVEAARIRLRPILMTSFAFILGVLPLVLATGAGANARKSIGITVFSGMFASTCLAVLFVPSFYVVVQRFEEWRKARSAAKRVKADAGSSQPA